MTLWQSFKESILELIFGRYQLDCWRAEDDLRAKRKKESIDD